MATVASHDTAERFEWVELHGEPGRDLFRGSYRGVAGHPCPGVRVVRGRGEPGEATEGHLASHTVVVNLGPLTHHEFSWEGGPWERHAVPPLAAHVLPAGVPHAVRWDEPVESLVVEISAHFAAEVAVAEPSRGRVELRPAPGIQDRFVAHAALALAEEVEGGSPGGRLCGESLAGALVLRLLGTHGQLRPRLRAAERLSRPLLARVLGHAGDHLDQDLSLKELAAVAQMDVFRFVRAFKETLGVPPHQYLVRARIDRARSLLGSSARPISEVALATGFATPSHFATTFRRVTGMTPRTYRRSLR